MRLHRSVQRAFWREIAAGVSTLEAAAAAGVSPAQASRWFRDAGGMPPLSLAQPTSRHLSITEREMILAGMSRGDSIRKIAGDIGRAPSTVLRELRRNRGSSSKYRPAFTTRPATRPASYSPSAAQGRADRRMSRPKASKIAMNPRLRAQIRWRLAAKHSPEQIAARLREDFPDDEQMRISHEAIYRSLYVQGRGELRRELTRHLRTGRSMRKPRARSQKEAAGTGGPGRIKDMVSISERPPEIEDRAMPGAWEGDLIVGENNASQIGTLVERITRFVILLHLPAGRDAATVADQMIAQMRRLPALLRGSITWDQGKEMAEHARIAKELDLTDGVFFCDPHSPWQRGTNENTNGLLRQYFPKSTDLSIYPQDYLDYVAFQLNSRPRKTLGWATPAEALHRLLTSPPHDGVALTS